MRRTRRLAAGAVLALAVQSTPSCLLVEYSDHLVDERTRGNFVTQPASIGGLLGFIIGIPIDIVGLPITYPIYRLNKSEGEENLDPLSTLLFPSFVLWRTGVLVIGAPLDLLEFTFYRAWQRPSVRELPELEIDELRPAGQEQDDDNRLPRASFDASVQGTGAP
ncbi:MAG: hypothetical protein H6832_13540 [Planctomycetes bacterium]|nr:hypothetical protein [Planctomycetota bacterium]MCB9919420.1 hypothetical protein [Planctomycetota bacterium]